MTLIENIQAARDALAAAHDEAQAVVVANAQLQRERTAARTELEAALARIRELEAAQAPASPWTLLHSDVFTSPHGFELRNETQSNDKSRNLPQNATIMDGGLTIFGKREKTGSGSSARDFTTADVLGRHLVLPNHFRAEIRAKMPRAESGVWPCPLWFRPANGNDGEIDVLEVMGAHPPAGATLHQAYNGTPRMYHSPTKIRWPDVTDPTGWHTYVVEKTPGRIEMWMDGKSYAVFTKAGAPSGFPWDAIFENPVRTWYPRFTLQLGGGSNVGHPADTFTDCVMAVRDYRAWAWSQV